jgi:hypothetical protein
MVEIERARGPLDPESQTTEQQQAPTLQQPIDIQRQGRQTRAVTSAGGWTRGTTSPSKTRSPTRTIY